MHSAWHLLARLAWLTPALLHAGALAQQNPVTVEVRLAASSDDAEEAGAGTMNLTSGDLELLDDGGLQAVGIRFPGVAIPRGAMIDRAYVQFQADETSSEPTVLHIEGESSDDAAAFTTAVRDLSSRARTMAIVSWSPVPWTDAGAAGSDEQTRDVAALIQEIVDRPGWTSGNAIALIITGTGRRVAESYDGKQSGAPRLHVEYSSRATTTTSLPPNSTTTTTSSSVPGSTTSTTLPAAVTLPPCPDGRFLVDSCTLVDPTAHTEAVAILTSKISIGTACPPVAGKLRRTKKRGMRITAAWPACAGFSGPVRLNARVDAECLRMNGRLVARRSKVKRAFSAFRSKCGDGAVDAGSGEECDSGVGCGPGHGCSEGCRCVAGLVQSISFSADLQPFFTTRCATPLCHSGSEPEQGLDLSPGAAYGALVNVTSTQCASTKLVAPSDPEASYLVWKVRHSGPCLLGSRMPPAVRLSASNVESIIEWIAQGAPNN